MVTIPRQTMFTVYVTTSTGDALSTPVYTISYSGKVEVPQNCEVNAGQVVEFDFGDIGASLFSQAGRVIVRKASRRKRKLSLLNVPTSRRRPIYLCGLKPKRPQGRRWCPIIRI